MAQKLLFFLGNSNAMVFVYFEQNFQAVCLYAFAKNEIPLPSPSGMYTNRHILLQGIEPLNFLFAVLFTLNFILQCLLSKIITYVYCGQVLKANKSFCSQSTLLLELANLGNGRRSHLNLALRARSIV